MSSICLPEEKDPKVSPFQMILLNRLQDEFFRKKTEDDNINMEITEIRNKRKFYLKRCIIHAYNYCGLTYGIYLQFLGRSMITRV